MYRALASPGVRFLFLHMRQKDHAQPDRRPCAPLIESHPSPICNRGLHQTTALASRSTFLTMHLGLLPIALLLTWSLPFAHADGLNQKFESATTNRSLASTFNNNCSQQIEDKNNPICLHPGPPRDPLVHSYTVSDPDNPWMRPFSFHLTVPRTLTAATWAKVQIANLRSTLPSILTQLGVDPSQVAALVSEGIPLVVAANDAIHSKRSILSPPSNFARREPTSNIRSWVRK